MTTHRVRAGDTVSIVIDQTDTSGTWEAVMVDALGRRMAATVPATFGGIQVVVAASEWIDGTPGIGRVELKRTQSGVTTYPAAEQVRILPGIAASGTRNDYA